MSRLPLKPELPQCFHLSTCPAKTKDWKIKKRAERGGKRAKRSIPTGEQNNLQSSCVSYVIREVQKNKEALEECTNNNIDQHELVHKWTEKLNEACIQNVWKSLNTPTDTNCPTKTSRYCRYESRISEVISRWRRDWLPPRDANISSKIFHPELKTDWIGNGDLYSGTLSMWRPTDWRRKRKEEEEVSARDRIPLLEASPGRSIKCGK